jgi:hypothetical protein
MAAASTTWNSGRLTSMIAMASPRERPNPASPPAVARTRSAYSLQVKLISLPLVRIATRSP